MNGQEELRKLGIEIEDEETLHAAQRMLTRYGYGYAADTQDPSKFYFVLVDKTVPGAEEEYRSGARNGRRRDWTTGGKGYRYQQLAFLASILHSYQRSEPNRRFVIETRIAKEEIILATFNTQQEALKKAEELKEFKRYAELKKEVSELKSKIK